MVILATLLGDKEDEEEEKNVGARERGLKELPGRRKMVAAMAVGEEAFLVMRQKKVGVGIEEG